MAIDTEPKRRAALGQVHAPILPLSGAISDAEDVRGALVFVYWFGPGDQPSDPGYLGGTIIAVNPAAFEETVRLSGGRDALSVGAGAEIRFRGGQV